MASKSKNISLEALNECIETLVSSKLVTIQADNEKLLNENSSLREMNKLLVKKIDILISKIES